MIVSTVTAGKQRLHRDRTEITVFLAKCARRATFAHLRAMSSPSLLMPQSKGPSRLSCRFLCADARVIVMILLKQLQVDPSQINIGSELHSLHSLDSNFELEAC